MKHYTLSALSILAGLAVSTSSFAFEAPVLTELEIANLQNGDAFISVCKDRERDHKPTISRGGIDINVAASEILTIMKDCDLMAKVSPDIRGCEVLEESEDGSWDIRKQKFAVSPILPKFKTTFRTNYTSDPVNGYVMKIEKISGDLKVQEGRWDIISLGPNESRVIYQAALKPSLPIPAKIIRKQVAIGIPDILRSLRAVAEGEGEETEVTAATEVLQKEQDDM